MTNPITQTQAEHITKLIMYSLVVVVVLIAYVFFQGYTSRSDDVKNKRAGCERNKLDRRDNADFQTAQAKYISNVVLAASVHEDVKRAAREAVTTFNRTSKSLTMRSKIDCTKAFPDARLLP